MVWRASPAKPFLGFIKLSLLTTRLFESTNRIDFEKEAHD